MRCRGALVLPILVGLLVGACAGEDPEAPTADTDLVKEGTPEATAVLALVNDVRVTAAELTAAKVPNAPATALIAHRNGVDNQPGTADDDPFDTLAELRAIRGVGPATLDKLLAYAKQKGLLGGDVEIVFSPQPKETSHLARIAREIDTATTSIDIAIYSYSDAKISEALARAQARGVKVRFLYNDGRSNDNLPASSRGNSTSGKLEASGVDVRYVNKTMHHKFMIVDGPRDALEKAKTARLVTGSANWSSSAATRFDENTLFVKNNEELVLRFQRDFNVMWEHSRDFVSQPMPFELSSAVITDAAITDAANVDAVFTSSNFTARGNTFSTNGANTVADALVAAIGRATRSIHVASGHLRSRPVSEALMAKKRAVPGLDVRVYLDGQEYISQAGHAAQLRDLDECVAAAGASEAKKRNCTDKGFLFGYQITEAGVDVRYKYYAYRWDHGYAPQMHHKYMVVDGETLFTGSYNLSDNAEHDTFENMVVLRGAENAATVAAFEKNFESIWKTGREEDKLGDLTRRVESAPEFPIVFDAMALGYAEVTELKAKIKANCGAVDSPAFREDPGAHMSCRR